LESLIRRGFSERRKQLRNMLPEYKDRWSEICAKLGVQETLRAEELSLAQWEEFARFVSPQSAQRGEEMFDVVDEQDRVLEAKPRDTVHVNNLRHRASHMLIFNRAGELFLQKRSIWKDRNPAVWDSSAAGHVDAGETYLEAAVREVREEIGVDCELEKIGKLPCMEENGWEFIEVFRGQHEGPFKLAPLEVEAGAFFPLNQVREWLARSPEEFSPVFPQVLRFI